MKKVPPSEKLRKEIDEILAGNGSEDEDVLGGVNRAVFENGVSEDPGTGSTGLFGERLLRARDWSEERPQKRV